MKPGLPYESEGTAVTLLPRNIPASESFLERHGVYLVDDGQRILIVLKPEVDDDTIYNVTWTYQIFGYPSLEEFQQVYRFDPVEGLPYNAAVGAILEEMSRLTNNYCLPKVVVIEGDENYETLVKRDFIEDSNKQYPLSAEQFAESFSSLTSP
jgi:hypothetical protein